MVQSCCLHRAFAGYLWRPGPGHADGSRVERTGSLRGQEHDHPRGAARTVPGGVLQRVKPLEFHHAEPGCLQLGANAKDSYDGSASIADGRGCQRNRNHVAADSVWIEASVLDGLGSVLPSHKESGAPSFAFFAKGGMPRLFPRGPFPQLLLIAPFAESAKDGAPDSLWLGKNDG